MQFTMKLAGKFLTLILLQLACLQPHHPAYDSVTPAVKEVLDPAIGATPGCSYDCRALPFI
jgi:hypothetical protein